MSNEMMKMRQQLEYLQAELCARGGPSPNEVQVFQLYASHFLHVQQWLKWPISCLILIHLH